jgi:hypothetical protein
MYGVPTIDWSTVSAASISASQALEQFITWLAQDAAMFATKAERGEIPMPEAMEEVAKAAGQADAVGMLVEFKQMLDGRCNEIRTELAEWNRKNGSQMPHGKAIAELEKQVEINE